MVNEKLIENIKKFVEMAKRDFEKAQEELDDNRKFELLLNADISSKLAFELLKRCNDEEFTEVKDIMASLPKIEYGKAVSAAKKAPDLTVGQYDSKKKIWEVW